MTTTEVPPQRFARLRARLHSALLEVIGWIVRSRAFRFLLRPILKVWLYIYAFRLAFGATPRVSVPSGSVITEETAGLIARLEDARNKPVTAEFTDRERSLIQSMTWGTAGAAVLILVAICTSSKTLGLAMSVAAGLFAVSIPLLTAFGFAYMHHREANTSNPPATQVILNLHALIYFGQMLFVLGIVAMLWDFNRWVAGTFLVACYFGMRAFKNLVTRYVTPASAKKVTSMLAEAHAAATEKATSPGPSNDANASGEKA